MINSTPQVVTIAGSDSGGGAGVQADLKTFQARGVFGTSIFVALTAQNTRGVDAVFEVSNEFIDAQFESLASDLKILACKTGMLDSVSKVETVVKNLKQQNFGPYVLDPVMIAKGGFQLLDDDAVDVIRKKLMPLATVITPNIPEAEVLAQMEIQSKDDMVSAARKLQKLGANHVIIKGGHSDGARASDFVLFRSGKSMWLHGERIDTENTHGTGDTFSSCIVAELAKNSSLEDAIITAKKFIQGAIADGIFVGHGHGPTNHWAQLDESIEVEYVSNGEFGRF